MYLQMSSWNWKILLFGKGFLTVPVLFRHFSIHFEQHKLRTSRRVFPKNLNLFCWRSFQKSCKIKTINFVISLTDMNEKLALFLQNKVVFVLTFFIVADCTNFNFYQRRARVKLTLLQNLAEKLEIWILLTFQNAWWSLLFLCWKRYKNIKFNL